MQVTPTIVGMDDPTRRLALLLAMVRVHDTIGLLTLRREALARGDADLANAAEHALTSLPKFDVGVARCTGYNAYHLDTNPQPTRKGRPITKASKQALDGAVAAINGGTATHLAHDGRNDYVLVQGAVFGLHRQVFEQQRQLFPVGSIDALPTGLLNPDV
jgi:hypothetical protein